MFQKSPPVPWQCRYARNNHAPDWAKLLYPEHNLCQIFLKSQPQKRAYLKAQPFVLAQEVFLNIHLANSQLNFILELFKESHISKIQQSNIINLIFHHHHSVQANAKGKSLPLVSGRSQPIQKQTGCTIPAPTISSQPEWPQTLQPLPPQTAQDISTSKLGSVKGKKLGRNLILTSWP